MQQYKAWVRPFLVPVARAGLALALVLATTLSPLPVAAATPAVNAGAKAPSQAGASGRPARAAKAAAKPRPGAAHARPLAPGATPATTPPRSGKGWQLAPVPGWVVEPPAPLAGAVPAPAVGARREQLVDFQSHTALATPQYFVRIRSVALDAASLGEVSQWQVNFNPAFQRVELHHADVVRDGQRSQRLDGARIEPMRREQRLEEQVLDGSETLLVVLNDVRVGDGVELAYTVHGDNPIFGGRLGGAMQLAFRTPVELLHHRWLVKADRPLFIQPLATDEQAERFTENGLQVLRMVRHQVAAVPQELNTPPWVKQLPALEISDYASWNEVEAWAAGLFALPAEAHPEVAQRAQALAATGLKGAALASEALRFVQDDVRYLSVSLGESSHRPKPPQQTLTERLGDCKDKVLLLNALLQELGFTARPALVSTYRLRGLSNHLPSHAPFDHVITQLELDGRQWYVDPTLTGQGQVLEQRGQVPYGMALVVGSAAGLQPVPEPGPELYRLHVEQRWDLSRPGQPVQLAFELRGDGLMAELWRRALASAGLDAVAQTLAGGFSRVLPGLRPLDPGSVQDDRQANRLVFSRRFELDDFGRYEDGVLLAEFGALEMLDLLNGPPESQRRTPFLVAHPLRVDSRIEVRAAAPLPGNPPPMVEVQDKQFRFSARLEIEGSTVNILRRYDRRQDQVLPADLNTWRERVLRARQSSFGVLRLPLIDIQAQRPEFEKLDREMRRQRDWRDDRLQSMLARYTYKRHIDSQVLQQLPPTSPLALQALRSRAVTHNLLGEHASALADAERVLGQRPEDADALESKAVALFGLGRAEEALASFQQIPAGSRTPAVSSWMGSLNFALGQAEQAERLLREAVDQGSGEGREFALLWLYLAAEQQGGRGADAVKDMLDEGNADGLPQALLRYLMGRMDEPTLLKRARADAQMERLNLAEAHFFIGQKKLLQGDADAARRAFQRVLDTRATPYREISFAQLALQRASK